MLLECNARWVEYSTNKNISRLSCTCENSQINNNNVVDLYWLSFLFYSFVLFCSLYFPVNVLPCWKKMYHPIWYTRTILRLLYVAHSSHVWCHLTPLFYSMCTSPSFYYLGGSVVEHLLPGGIQGVLTISHQTLLCHIDHLPGSCVHWNGSFVAQSCFLGLLLCLQRADRTFTAYRSGIWQGHKPLSCWVQLQSDLCQTVFVNHSFWFKMLEV